MAVPENPVRALARFGQSPWLDFISRGLLESGALRRLIADDGVRGVTSNPSIFEKAIGGSRDYHASLRALQETGLGTEQIFEALATEDVRRAADELADVYASTHGLDGYVSLEVSPALAHDAAGTVAAARRLWRSVDRQNLMIKVPGTAAGTAAIEDLVAEGLNVNVTLLFSLAAYRAAAEAFVRGLERRRAAGKSVAGIASVASFFVSRIDTKVDALLEPRGREDLMGQAAVANARLAYREFRAMLDAERWRSLAAAGAMPQRLLWASTSTKSPRYRDVKYVEELIGKDTVNTMPTATLEAFRDHGRARDSLAEEPAAAERCMAALAAAGVDFEAVTAALLEEGVELFAQAYAGALRAVADAAAGAG
jgi:transaldolase/glucose-6-phosphate isomerase